MPEACFICGKPATSVDHVPPRSFFPKLKDMPQGASNPRSDLITVPACDDHNQRYSKDDEVASYVILLSNRTNKLGVGQFLKKGNRAITGRKGLISAIFKRIEVFRLPDGRELPTVEFDSERVDRVMERIARGLFYHEFGRPWACTLTLLSEGPLMPDLSPNPYREAIKQLSQRFDGVSRKGANPEAFWYEWAMGESGDCSNVIRMCFYDGLEYYAVPKCGGSS